MSWRARHLEQLVKSGDETIRDYLTIDEIRRERDHCYEQYHPDRLPFIVDEILILESMAKRNIFEIGKLLTEAKEIVGHGEFQNFIEKNFDFSYQTANNMMNVYRCCLGRPELLPSFKKSVWYQISAPGFDPDLREFLLANAHRFKKELGNKAVKELDQKLKNNEIAIDGPEIRDLIRCQKEKDEHKRYHEEVEHILISLWRFQQKIKDNRSKRKPLLSFLPRFQKGNPEKSSPRWPIIKWPTLNGKVLLTQSQADRLETLLADMVKELENLKPEYEIVEEAEA